MRKHNSLQKMYYIRFASMIVIPILLVFTVSLSIIRIMMENSAISAIQSSQNTIVSSLTESIKDASLQLSHFIYVNNTDVYD